MPRSLLLVLFFCTLGQLATAQERYAVRVGTFEDVTSEDFEQIGDLGFVYGSPRQGQLTDVFVGQYANRQGAAATVAALNDRGFRNAAIVEVENQENDEATFVQIALRGRSRTLGWERLERAGDLYIESIDGTVKVLVGPFVSDTSANTALTRARSLGYRDAFSRSLDIDRLIEVDVFETGIKKPLIPIDLTQRRTETQPEPEPTPPALLAADPAPAAPPTDTLEDDPLPVETVRIDVQTKRHSAAELQRVLKEKGLYDGAIDGYYGSGTETAYRTAIEEMPALLRYRAALTASNASPLSWPEMQITSMIAEDLAAGTRDAELESTMAEERPALLAADKPIAPARTLEARQWENNTWESLNTWAAEDPLHAYLLSALRISYYQSQSRLEAMYQQRGLEPIDARNAATALLENVLAASLARFG